MVDTEVTTYERTFHVPARDWNNTKEEQENNFSVVLQDAINRGHRPTGSPKFEGATEHGERKTSMELRYSLPVEPLRPEPWVDLSLDEGPTATARADDITKAVEDIDYTQANVEDGHTDLDKTSYTEETGKLEAPTAADVLPDTDGKKTK